MKKERKIKAVVKKVTFAEAENEDDQYWAQASPEQRFQELIELRQMVFADADDKIIKIVSIRNIHDEEN